MKATRTMFRVCTASISPTSSHRRIPHRNRRPPAGAHAASDGARLERAGRALCRLRGRRGVPQLRREGRDLLRRISNYQPLPDGNKRTGYDVMMEFIERNGHSFEHVDGDILLTASMIERSARRASRRKSSSVGSPGRSAERGDPPGAVTRGLWADPGLRLRVRGVGIARCGRVCGREDASPCVFLDGVWLEFE